MKTITYKTNKPNSSDTYICMLEFYLENYKGIWKSMETVTDGKNGQLEVYINNNPESELEWEKVREYSDYKADYQSSWTVDIDEAHLLFESFVY